MIWLPGAFETPENFIDAGFDVEVRKRGLALDLEFVEVEFAHVGDRSGIDRLEREILAPARDLGCRSIWLGGISLGGFFALDYAATHAGDWHGLCLLAPYLGNRRLIVEIAGAPGVAAWQAGPLAESDEERRIWRFIQARAAQARHTEPRPADAGPAQAETPPAPARHAEPRPAEAGPAQARHTEPPPLYLGYGRDDRFVQAHDLMASTLPAGAVRTVSGGHDWRTWTTLWEQFLDSRWI